MPTSLKPLPEAIKAKAAELDAARERLRQGWKENTADWQKLMGGAEILNVKINVPNDLGSPSPSGMGPVAEAAMGGVQRTLFESAGAETTIKDQVIEQLKSAGIKGIKAATIRRAVEAKLGRTLHYKTIGMTLYRIAEKGEARREGFVWYWEPKS